MNWLGDRDLSVLISLTYDRIESEVFLVFVCLQINANCPIHPSDRSQIFHHPNKFQRQPISIGNKSHFINAIAYHLLSRFE
jgi:hypothetical protein